MAMKDKRRLKRNQTRQPKPNTQADQKLLAAYKKVSNLPAANSESDRLARRLLFSEIRKIERRLNSGISTSDLSHLAKIAAEELARNKRLLNS
jgi:hypothetical protein